MTDFDQPYGATPQSPPSLDPPNFLSPDSQRSRMDEEVDDSVIRGDAHEALASVASTLYSSESPDDGQQLGRKRTSSASSSSLLGLTDKRTATKICRVCGDKAFSYNFNVITCESCKAFFRRNANKEKEIRCPFNDACDINIVSRRFCQRCRLHKCFRVGMKKEWIMTEEARLEKKQRVMDNRERRLSEAHNRGVNLCNEEGDNLKPVTIASASAVKRSDIIGVVGRTEGLYQPQMAVLNPQPNSLAPSVVVNTRRDSECRVVELPSPSMAAAGFRPPSLNIDNCELGEALLLAPKAIAVQGVNNTFLPGVDLYGAQQNMSRIEAHIAQVQLAAQLQQHAQLEHQRVARQHLTAPLLAPTSSAVQSSHMISLNRGGNRRLLDNSHQHLNTIIAPSHLTDTSSGSFTAIRAAVADTSSMQLSLRSPINQRSANELMSTEKIDRDTRPPTPKNDDGMVRVPRDLLLRLVEQRQVPGAQPPEKCSCTCICGRYPQATVIADEIAKELASEPRNEERLRHTVDENSSSLIRESVSNRERSSVVTLLDKAESVCSPVEQKPSSSNWVAASPARSTFHASTLLEVDAPLQSLDPECASLNDSEQMRVRELVMANRVWAMELDPNDAQRHAQGNPSKVDMVNMADGAIRRLIKMTKKIETFRGIEHRDQILLLKHCCLEYLILRGAMSYDPRQNVWKGPTPQSGYIVKMDAMKDTQDNMFESSIKFYATFKEEWRTNETVMLLLGMIVLFNPEIHGLSNVMAVKAANCDYRRMLKRYLFDLCAQDAYRTTFEFKDLMSKLDHLKVLNQRAQSMLQEVNSSDMEPLLLEVFERKSTP